MRHLVCFLAFAWIAFGAAAQSETQSQAYEDARSVWLAGADDRAALHRLSELALASDLSAQVLLGLIERRTVLFTHIAKDMDRDAYRRIFRRPNGRFGDRWLEVAATRSDTAALLSVHPQEDYAQRSRALAEAGLI